MTATNEEQYHQYHISALLLDATRELSFVSDILENAPQILPNHHLTIKIIIANSQKSTKQARDMLETLLEL